MNISHLSTIKAATLSEISFGLSTLAISFLASATWISAVRFATTTLT
jgi:hypothetical protein